MTHSEKNTVAEDTTDAASLVGGPQRVASQDRLSAPPPSEIDAHARFRARRRRGFVSLDLAGLKDLTLSKKSSSCSQWLTVCEFQ